MECRIIFCRNIIDLETHYDLSFAGILFIDFLIFYKNKLLLKPFNFMKWEWEWGDNDGK